MLIPSLINMAVGAPGDIEEVVLMPDRAEVIRSANGPCRSGAAEIVFAGLPRTLDTRTLRAFARGTTEVLGVRHEAVDASEEATGEAAELRRQLDALDDDRLALDNRDRDLKDRDAQLNRWIDLYRSTLAEDIRLRRPDRRRWNRELDAFRARREAIAKDRRQLAADRKAYALKRSRVQRRLQQIANQSSRSIKASATARCRGAQATVKLAYVVPEARWTPEYALDFTPSGARRGRVRLTFSALVEQSTPEDWPNVTLKLSTARPRLGVEPPRPRQTYIDGAKRKTQRVLVEGYEKRESLKPGGRADPQAPTQASVDDRGTSVVLTVPGRVTVLADGRQHWFPVDETRASASQALVALPRLKRGVFRVARFKNPAPYPLLGGRMNTFVNGAFVGHSPLDFVGAAERVEVSLGLESGLAVERDQRRDQEAVSGFLSKTKHLTRAYRSRIANRTGRAVKLEVREQVPVAQNDKITVKLIEAGMTGGYRLDAERGIVRWELTIPARKTKNVDVAFEIRLPDDWKMN